MKELFGLFLFLVTGFAWAAEKPNIVFILVDDVGVGDIKSYYPSSKVKTPNIDSLAVQGMRFTQAYAPCSVCSPSRYALLSGFYPSRGPLRDKHVNTRSPLAIDLDMMTLPGFLKERGYRTAHIGKWHLGYGSDGPPNWAGELRPGPNEIGFDYHLGIPKNHNDDFKTYVENGRLLWLKDGIAELTTAPTKDQLTKIRYDDEVDSTLTEKAIEFIKENRDQPFFVCLALVATHTHITPREKFRGTSEIGQLGDYIYELDYHVGEIMATLDELELADDTILIFSSDNGAQKDDFQGAGKNSENLDLGAGRNLNLRSESHDVAVKARTAKTDARVKHGHRSNGDFRGYKAGNFEGGFRVPYIARWPGRIPAGVESDQIVTLADTLATVAGFLGEELSDSAGGDSFDLSPVFLGEEAEGLMPRNVILQAARGELAFRDGDWKLRFTEAPDWTGEEVELPESAYELYNLAYDLSEERDLSQEDPERAEAMRNHLLELLKRGRSR